jgi:hypothetical protein
VTLEERDRTIEALREKINEATLSLSSIKKVVALSCSRAAFEIETLRTKQQAIKQYVQETMLPSMQSLVSDTSSRIIKRTTTIVEESTKTLLAKYRYEVQQRKIIYNKLQELKGSEFRMWI